MESGRSSRDKRASQEYEKRQIANKKRIGTPCQVDAQAQRIDQRFVQLAKGSLNPVNQAVLEVLKDELETMPH